MLQITNTPQYAGVTVAGDYQDLDELYEVLHLIVGEEGELPSYDSVRLQVLGVCYDIRHLLMGDRGAMLCQTASIGSGHVICRSSARKPIFIGRSMLCGRSYCSFHFH